MQVGADQANSIAIGVENNRNGRRRCRTSLNSGKIENGNGHEKGEAKIGALMAQSMDKNKS